MMKKNHVAVAVTLALGAAGVQAATTNSAATVPNVLIGGSAVTLGNIQLIEGGAGQLSATSPSNTVYIQLPTGVSFSDTTVTAAVSNTAAGTVLSSGSATLEDTDGDSKNDRATWTIGTASAVAATILISSIDVNVASTVAAGDISVSIASKTPGNPGLTSGSVVSGRAVTAGTTNELTTTAPNVHIGGTAQVGGTLLITESATGTLASGKTITVSLPTGVSFGAKPTATPTNMDIGATANTAQAATMSSDSRTATWTVASGGASTGSSVGQLSIPMANLTVGATVAAGAINATIGGTGSVTAGDVQIATAATGSTTSSAVNTTLGKTPAGRNAVTASNILIKENFGEVVSDAGSSTVTLTLPDGVTFAAQPVFTPSVASAAATVSSSIGFQTSTITIPVPNSTATDTTTTTYTVSGLSVNVASSVSAGDLSVAIAGSTGSGVTAASVAVLTVVDSSVTVTANTTIPTVGIGASGQGIGEFTIKEDVASALLANSSTITLALPAGVTWSAAPTVSATGSMGLGTVTLSSDSQTATVPVSTASSSAATITVSGSISVASTVSAGDIAVTIGGTAGASGTATVATAAQGTTTAVSSITSLTAGTPTQSIGTLSVTESFQGAIAASGQFRVVLPTGLTWATATPAVTTALTGSSGTKLVATVDTANSYSGTTTTGANWEFERATTFSSNDTLIIRAPSTASTGATKVSFAGLKVNVASGTADGNVEVSINDGDLSATHGAGVIGSMEVVAVVGTPLALSADSTDLSITTSGTGTVTLSGGVGSLSISTQPDSTVATASLVNGVLTVTPVAVGTTSVVVSDSASTPSTLTINITVSQVMTPPDTGTPATLSGNPTNATIAAGVSDDSGASYSLTGSFAAADSLDVTGSIAIDPNDVGQQGSILVVAALDQGAGMMWFMKDSTGAWQMWDGQVSNLIAADGPRTLAATETVSVATGLSGLPGTFDVFVGYEVGGEIVYNTTPVHFVVE
ncbi:beta strand repeat-containing protein [Endothiovibrio diazotrophicus]